MFRAILVPLDGSAMAEQALPVAARLARATDSALHLVHVHVAANPDPIAVEGLPVVDDELRSLAAEHERVYLERVAAPLAEGEFIPVTMRLSSSVAQPVAQALASYARDIRAGLIVMTTHGRSGFAHLWLGSVAESLARHSGTPLLLLRPGEDGVVPDRPFRRVLVPLDGSPLAEEILPHARALAEVDGGELELLRIVDTLPVPESMPFHERFRLEASSVAAERAAAEEYLAELAGRLAPALVHPNVAEADPGACRAQPGRPGGRDDPRQERRHPRGPQQRHRQGAARRDRPAADPAPGAPHGGLKGVCYTCGAPECADKWRDHVHTDRGDYRARGARLARESHGGGRCSPGERRCWAGDRPKRRLDGRPRGPGAA
jgi:nucleotide-binding universal stress UspA family protein